MNEAPTEIHLLQNQQQVGPFPPDAVRAMVAAGTVSPDDLAWSPGMPEWLPVSALLPDATPPEPNVAPTARFVPAATSRPKESFFAQLLGSFLYPFHGDGLIILIGGTLFFTFLGFLQRFAGLVAILIGGISVGYFFATLQLVVQSTTQGENKLPKWPEFSDWKSDIWDPAIQWLGTVVVCFGPAYGALIYFGVTAAMKGGAAAPGLEAFVVPGILLLIGLIYFPMALLAVAMFDSLTALNPLLIFRSMAIAPLHYVVLATFLGALFVGNLFVSLVVGSMQIPILGSLISGFVSLYTSLLSARMLGLFYRANDHRLGWF